jgi:Fe-Mn family superoxide dismutase
MFQLPELAYGYSDLEPFLSALTLKTHHSRHHAGYTDKFNKAIAGTPLAEKTAEEILSNVDEIPEEIQEAVLNNGGGYYNHKLYWETLKPNPNNEENRPTGELLARIEDEFGSFEAFKEEFSNAAKTQFGSGWAWLVIDNGDLLITQTLNQFCPLSLGQTPLLCVDVWEHAYYLDYKNLRPDYLEKWWSIVNWDQVQANLNNA